MDIERIIVGEYETNCYILRENDESSDCLVIDIGIKAGPLIQFLSENKLNPVAVVLTHGHIDHIRGLAELKKIYPDIKVYIHKLDNEMLTGSISNLSDLTGRPFSTQAADFLLEDGNVIEEAGVKLSVLSTPGHTAGGVCFSSADEQIVFVGDTLFADSVGRTDFPGGSPQQLLKSIKEKLLTLPDETVCFPGHGPRTTIAHEKTHNPFLK